MHIKNLKVCNSKLLRQVTWANRTDRFLNRVSIRIYRKFMPQTQENIVYLKILESAVPYLNCEKERIEELRRILKANSNSALLTEKLQELRNSLENRRYFFEENIRGTKECLEKARQYRKEL